MRVFESVDPLPPHARTGGCLFYNTPYMQALFEHMMVPDRDYIRVPLLEAIVAHEIGHEMHDDFGSQREDLSIETRELQADRFAGYTLERLHIGLDLITPYYGLAGDEFTGSQAIPAARHGASSQRIAALKHGWDLARWHLPEDYVAPIEGASPLSDSQAR